MLMSWTPPVGRTSAYQWVPVTTTCPSGRVVVFCGGVVVVGVVGAVAVVGAVVVVEVIGPGLGV
jgi:hypothetical protein